MRGDLVWIIENETPYRCILSEARSLKGPLRGWVNWELQGEVKKRTLACGSDFGRDQALANARSCIRRRFQQRAKVA